MNAFYKLRIQHIDRSEKSNAAKAKKYLELLGSITSWDAITHFRDTRLAVSISEIKRRYGLNIVTIMELDKNTGKRYGRYHLIG